MTHFASTLLKLGFLAALALVIFWTLGLGYDWTDGDILKAALIGLLVMTGYHVRRLRAQRRSLRAWRSWRFDPNA